MASSYVQGLIPTIRKILESSDLGKISAKGVRKQLIAKGHDEATIKDNRSAIDAEIEKIYEELTAANDAASSSSDDVPLDSITNPPSSLPEPLRSRPKIKTEVKSEIKTERKPLPVREETDEEMAARLQREFDAEQSRGRPSRSAGSSRPKKKTPTKKRKSKATVDSGEEGETPKKRRGGGGGEVFNKELILSDALAAVLGESRLSRPQVVKRIWAYIKENDLQYAEDRRMINCDEALRTIFHTDRIHMFTMNKVLVPHLRDPDEIAFKDEPRPARDIHYVDSSPSLPVELGPPLDKVEPAEAIHRQTGFVKAEDMIDSDEDDSD